jgi:endonuclease/exonuclease/phosphatase (EEP) superfamily protein YafD
VGVSLLTAGWLIVGVLGLVALLRLVAWDSIEPLIVLNALTFIIYLPAWVVAAGAVITRRWWLAAAAALIVAAQLVFVMPELFAAAPVPAWARHAQAVRVFDANIDASLDFRAGYVRAIEQDRPDLVTLEEIAPSTLQNMVASGVLASYPYRCAAPAIGATGFLIASRLRLTGCQVRTVAWDDTTTPYMMEATLWSPGGPVALRLVHTLAPLPQYWREWSAALAAIGKSVRASGAGNMLMVGDFNATWGNSGFAALLREGLTDGAAARGKATGMTWPNGAVVPPLVRIDHVLTGARLAVTQIAAKPGFGSDHRYLVATVAVRTRASR